jgi:hypothetical protein
MDSRPPRSGVSHPFRSASPRAVKRWSRGSIGNPAGPGLALPLTATRGMRGQTATRGGGADIDLHRASSNRSIVPDAGAQDQIGHPRRSMAPGAPPKAWPTPDRDSRMCCVRAHPTGLLTGTDAGPEPSWLGPRKLLCCDAEVSSGHLMILVTRPAPTVRPPSRMANLRPSSIAMG